MADNDVLFCQRAINELLFKEEIPAADSHHRLQCVYGEVCMCARLQRVYGEVCMGASSVRQ